MRPHVLFFLVLSLCFTTVLPAQEKSGSNTADTTRQAEELLELSIRQNSESHALALQTAQRALELWQAAGDRDGVARTYEQIARCYLVQNDLMEATKTYEHVLQLWRELNNPKQQAAALIKLGFIEVRKGEWSTAISLLTQAQSMLAETDAAEQGQIAVALGNIFSETGMPDAALVQLQRAANYYRQTPIERDDKRMLLEIGNAYYLAGNFSEALPYLLQALASFAPGTLDAAQSHEYLGRVYSSIGENTAALEHLGSALPIYDRVGNRQEAAQVRGLMGQVYQQQENLELAAQYYREALKAFVDLSDGLNQAAIHYGMGRLAMKRGDYDAAEDYLRQSIDETENLRRISTSRDLTVAFSATVHERYASYIECLMHRHQAKPSESLDVKAFETSELARARSLTELLRATRTDLVAGLEPQLAAQEKSLRQSLRAKEDYKVDLLGRDYTKQELDTLEADIKRLEGEYTQVTDTIRSRYPAYKQITRPTPLTLKQIQQQVLTDDQTILLEYSLGIDRSYLWAVTRSEFSSYELPGRAQIEELVGKLYRSLTAPQPRPGETSEQIQGRMLEAKADLTSQINDLSKTLLTPVANKLGTRRLLIVADGALQYIPFQTLTLPAQSSASVATARLVTPEERPLILDHEIVFEPSASVLALVLGESANRQPLPKSVAILADPVFEADDSRIKSAGGLSAQTATADSSAAEATRLFRDVGLDGDRIPRLLSSREEADAIMSVVPWRTGFKAVDFEANRTTAMESSLSQYHIVHFATHALLNDKHPESSRIVLSLFDQNGHRQDGFLSLQDIYNLKLPVDLVVLSACQTGLGKDIKGEGLIGLTRGFMYAGVSGVVASLWKVDDDATAELMKHFYSGLFNKGLSPAAALREAQLALREQKRWQEPYYWAGFVIQGQYNQTMVGGYQRPALKFATAGLLLALVLITGILAARWRRRRV